MPTTTKAASVGDLSVILPSWPRHLRAANLSERTVQSYTEAAWKLHLFLRDTGMPTKVTAIRREHVEAFIEAQLSEHAPATAASRYRSLQQLFRWLLDEGEIDRSPMERTRPPKVPEQPVPVVSESQLRALLAGCAGRGFAKRRDAALLTVFIDTGARLSEIAGACVADVDLDLGTLRVLGKGRRERVLPIGRSSVRALDRYLPRTARTPSRLKRGSVAGQARPDGHVRHLSDGASMRSSGRHRRTTSAPVPTHLRSPVARVRWSGGRPTTHRRMAGPGDASSLRSERCRRARSGRTSKPVSGRPTRLKSTACRRRGSCQSNPSSSQAAFATSCACEMVHDRSPRKRYLSSLTSTKSSAAPFARVSLKR